MATAADYLTVEEAKIDLRLDADANGFTDADLERYRDRALGIVSGLTGRILPDPALDAADVDPGLKALCSGRDGDALGRLAGNFAVPLCDGRPYRNIFSP